MKATEIKDQEVRKVIIAALRNGESYFDKFGDSAARHIGKMLDSPNYIEVRKEDPMKALGIVLAHLFGNAVQLV